MALKESMAESLSGTDIEKLSETVNNFAVMSAVAGAVAGLVPGGAGLVAALGQTGLVWTLYVQINKHLGISIKKNTMKFIGSAMLTNLLANVGAIITMYAASTVLSFIPILGQISGPLINMTVGYMIIYVSAVLYLNLLTKVMKAKGSFDFDESDETKDIIKEVVNEADLDSIMKESKAAYKQAKENGDFERAKTNPKCPSCGGDITLEQKFCQHCGAELK